MPGRRAAGAPIRFLTERHPGGNAVDNIRIPRRVALAAAGLAFLAPLRGGARAQQYPDRTVKWIVPYAAGGGSDVLARLVGAGLSNRLGQPVVIDNRPGGATNIGAEAAVKSAPDGYTVFTADNGTLVFNPALFRRLPYDVDRDFRPVGLLARFHLVLSVTRGSGIRSARDLLDRAKAEPGSISYGSAGSGSPHHLTMARLARETGAELTHVPYRGSAPALNDLLAGSVEAMVVDHAAGGEHLRSGRVRPLAVCSAAPVEGLPGVPTVQEALGLRGFEAYAWQGLVLPKRTPDPVAARLSSELSAVLRDEATAARMRELGVEPLPGGPGEFQALLEAERAVWVPLIRDLGITLD
jgi:tripartite-type tricarboxylate transporter receptor subunit TctC